MGVHTCSTPSSTRLMVTSVLLLGTSLASAALIEHRALRADSQDRPIKLNKLVSTKGKEKATCTDLVNHGTHFTVEIEVGTPGQKFDVVADTGSDALIVPSCVCVQAGYCSNKSRCFQGTNKSSTFSMETGPNGPPSIRMMFGSGPVQAVVATDTVQVGKLQTKMQDGILLMTDQLLNIKGHFEGILGLGLPSAEAKKSLYSRSPPSESPSAAKSDDNKKYVKSVKGQDAVITGYEAGGASIFPFPMQSDDDNERTWVVGVDDLQRSTKGARADHSFLQVNGEINKKPAGKIEEQIEKELKKLMDPEKEKTESIDGAAKNSTNETGLVVKGFMEEAGIRRFSMCFNDGTNGVLRLGTPPAKSAHGSVGQVHWGLDFRGISVGKVSAPALFCKPDNMTKGQKTPCGAIPDSGTTALMAPADQLITLYESLCDEWDRCKQNYTAFNKAAKDAKKAAVAAYGTDPFHIEAGSKAVIFQQLILDCKEWLSEEEGLDELPPIHFHVVGSNGTKQALQLKGWSYVIETQEKEFQYIYKNVEGIGKIPIAKNYTGKASKVCSPAFSPMEYNTEQNGPVWILGTPIFYEYQVGYDMEAQPPAISFLNEDCGACSSTKTKPSFVSESHAAKRGHARKPRQVNGPFRMPNIDFSHPL